MKKILILVIGLLILSCSSDDDSISQIVGEWKLVEEQTYGMNSEGEYELFTTDYSTEKIIYNFQLNGSLIVSGGESIGYSDGEYEYIFGEDYLAGDESGSKVLMVKINNSKWTYNLTNEKMRLGQSYVDGSDLIFERN